MSHLKNFVNKDITLDNGPEEKREPIRERLSRLINDGSNGTINMIVKKEAE